MRTKVVLDDKMVEEAMKISGEDKKRGYNEGT